jgi:pyruvate/2-oxoacid:ferredoxin oxidoreductase alpha subunit
MHLAPGSEHNDMGVITENHKNRKRMMEKRMGKLVSAAAVVPKPNLFTVPNAKFGLIGYGSNRGPIKEAQDRLAAQGIACDFLQLRTLWPFPQPEVGAFIAEHEQTFVVENNYTGQLMRLIRNDTGPLPNLHLVNKYNGKPFRPIEIIEAVEQRVKTPVGV